MKAELLYRIADIINSNSSTSQFIDEELRLIESELGIVDQDISSFKSEHLVPDLHEASSIYMNKVETTNSQLLELDNQLFMAKYVKRQLSECTAPSTHLLPIRNDLAVSRLTLVVVKDKFSHALHTNLSRSGILDAGHMPKDSGIDGTVLKGQDSIFAHRAVLHVEVLAVAKGLFAGNVTADKFLERYVFLCADKKSA